MYADRCEESRGSVIHHYTIDQGWVFLATRGAVEGGYRLGATTPTPLPGAGGRLETTPLTPLPLWLKKITNVLHN